VKTSLLFFNPEELNVLSHIHQIQPTPINLISFPFSINVPLTHNHIEQLLVSFQHLQRLELIIESLVEDRLINANRWKKFIIENLSKLINFNFKFFSGNINDKVLNRYRSSFWLNKN
ncbi:unnamed protein product, partial [Rotaria sp. Silwood2]